MYVCIKIIPMPTENIAYRRNDGRSKEVISTLEWTDGLTSISINRRDGNTTRSIDKAIQIIFKGFICVCLDPHMNGLNDVANNYLFQKVIRRLTFEHNLNYLVKENRIKIDKDKLTIELI